MSKYNYQIFLELIFINEDALLYLNKFFDKLKCF